MFSGVVRPPASVSFTEPVKQLLHVVPVRGGLAEKREPDLSVREIYNVALAGLPNQTSDHAST